MAREAKREHSAQTKHEILDAAEKLFAEKGFDGTGIMEIAKNANVPKSLIYYYFDKKEEILEELVKRMVREVIEMKYDFVGDMTPEESITREGMKNLLYAGYDFYMARIRVFKIIFQESLKNEFIRNFLLNIQISQQESIDYLKNAGMQVNDKDLKLGHFFLMAMPFMVFILQKDKWCEMNDYDPEEAREKFIDFMADVASLIMSKAVRPVA